MLEVEPNYWAGVTHYNLIPLRYWCHPLIALPLAVTFISPLFYAIGRAFWKARREGWDA